MSPDERDESPEPVSERDQEIRTAIGARLRAARIRRGMALGTVARLTGGEFKASAVANYERGYRAITVSRLVRLAELYGMSAAEILTAEDPSKTTIDLTAVDLTSAAEDRGPLVLDVRALTDAVLTSEFEMVRSYVLAIRAKRHDAGATCTVRSTDLVALARALARTPAAIESGLGPAVIRS